jgi:hypothetical protein
LSEAPSISIEQHATEELDELLAEDVSDVLTSPDLPPGPLVDLTLVRFSRELLETIPQEIAQQYRCLPVYLRKPKKKKRSLTPGILFLASATPDDAAMLEDCSLCCNLEVRAFFVDPQAVQEAIPIVYSGGSLERPAPASAAPTPPPLPPRAQKPRAPEPPAAPAPRAPSLPELPLVRPGAPATAAPPASPAEPRAPAAEPPPNSLLEMDSLPPGSLSLEPPRSQEPHLVVLGGDEGLAEYCQEAVAPLGGHVETWAFGPPSGEQPTPSLLVVSEEVYLFDRRAFNLLAFRLGAPLVVWSQDMDPADLQAVLLASRCAPDRDRNG